MANGYLTTHVLDTARGIPAAGMKVELTELIGTERRPLVTVVTNSDGRTDGPILPAAAFRVGVFELAFHAGAYFAGAGLGGAAPRFLDVIPIRFGLSDAQAHYHVPLLVSPFSYATYRGS